MSPNREFSAKSPLRLGGIELPFGGVTHVMGVINLSPESKNLHTVARDIDEAIDLAHRYRAWGASIIDLGGQSSHFENPTIDPDVELARLLPVIEALVSDGFLVSIDTWKPEVAREAVRAGGHLVNDTAGLTDPEMRRVVAEYSVAAVAVYVEGAHPHDVDEVDTRPGKALRTAEAFRRLLEQLEEEGIDQVVLDPGIALNYRGDYSAYT
ncbi:MAG: dihydropteroate synthase, partial [Acidimicrobiia bacterium]